MLVVSSITTIAIEQALLQHDLPTESQQMHLPSSIAIASTTTIKLTAAIASVNVFILVIFIIAHHGCTRLRYPRYPRHHRRHPRHPRHPRRHRRMLISLSVALLPLLPHRRPPMCRCELAQECTHVEARTSFPQLAHFVVRFE